ncbi:hypothetical protein ACU7M1_32855, partial [Burkholderia pseudomallei]
ADVQRLQAVCRLKSLIGIKFEALLCDSGRRGGVTRLRQFTAPRQCGRGRDAARAAPPGRAQGTTRATDRAPRRWRIHSRIAADSSPDRRRGAADAPANGSPYRRASAASRPRRFGRVKRRDAELRTLEASASPRERAGAPRNPPLRRDSDGN